MGFGLFSGARATSAGTRSRRIKEERRVQEV